MRRKRNDEFRLLPREEPCPKGVCPGAYLWNKKERQAFYDALLENFRPNSLNDRLRASGRRPYMGGPMLEAPAEMKESCNGTD